LRTLTFADGYTTNTTPTITQEITINEATIGLLDVDNIRIDTNTVSSTNTDGDINLSPNGAGQVVSNNIHYMVNGVAGDIQLDSSATGANATIATIVAPIIRLTNNSLTSVDMIPAGVEGQQLIIINQTDDPIQLNHNTGATAANRIKCPKDTVYTLSEGGAILLIYESENLDRWVIVDGHAQDPVCFLVRDSAGGAINTSATDIIYTDIIADTHSGYDVSTGVYTIPRTGIYQFNWVVTTALVSYTGSNRLLTQINNDGSLFIGCSFPVDCAGVSTTKVSGGSVILPLNKGETVKIVATSSVATTSSTTASNIHFSGWSI